MTTIKVWADFTCPYCYTAKAAFYRVVKDLHRDLTLEVMSFELNPDQAANDVQKLTECLMTAYGIKKAEAIAMAKQSEAMVQAAGLPADFLQIRSSNTHDAHRLYHYALTQKLGMRFFDLAQEAYFSAGLILNDHEALLKIAAAAGLDVAEAGQVLASDAFSARVRQDHSKAVEKKIQYVPHFVWPDGTFSEGVLQYDDFKAVLEG